jgi:hypothetical protein
MWNAPCKFKPKIEIGTQIEPTSISAYKRLKKVHFLD